ncbi:adenylyltransferase/cytidyltransferase family protein [Marispirochaeta aestuarii]|uniref:adenylyltransferase/cytidyltransferase family protein n=1 Tax=Marispirochaeta aestuarii TaxID=1963862 RepID=UPI002ABE83AB|nr:adenylyltransferase/cytidyltransferase family protein [Marispirochaeta aestuarii]
MAVIGYVTGVFDLFHVGHLNILRNSKLECDYLIVGVTSDELCLAEKKKKPVISFTERMEIVSAIRYVDQVVPQTDYDKMKAWKDLRFNRMFVGDDWKGTERWNRLEQEFKEVGVEIIYFPYTNGTSSTKIRKVIELMSNNSK